jgi:hypothetical protein
VEYAKASPTDILIQISACNRGPEEMLGEDEDWLWDVVNEMEQEDGLIWVYSTGDDGVMAFTDFGIETLTGLIEIYKADPDLLKRSSDPK